MEQDTALIIGAGRAHNASLMETWLDAGFKVRLVTRCGDVVREDERGIGAVIDRVDVRDLDQLMVQVEGALRGHERISLIVYDAGFAHDMLIDRRDPVRIDERIAEIRTGAMTSSICATTVLPGTPPGLFVMLGFAESFRNHPGYRRFARGPTAGFDITQALADSETPFKIAHIGLDGENEQPARPKLSELILNLHRLPHPLPRWRYELCDLEHHDL